MEIFDIIGPVMVGPSSSHTAGAVRIGYVAGKLLGEEIKEAEKAIETMGFEIENVREEGLPDGSKRVIGDLKKVRKTPKKYPRKYSIIKQKRL